MPQGEGVTVRRWDRRVAVAFCKLGQALQARAVTDL